MQNIHPTAVISPDAVVGEGVSIGAYTIVNEGVYIGDNSSIGSHCELGIGEFRGFEDRLIIGEESVIRSHSIFYYSSSFGKNLVTGHRVTVREKTTAGDGFQIGTLCDIQGHCVIGDYVKFHSNVHIGQQSKIGNYVWIFPYVVLTNDPHPPSETLLGCIVEDFAAIATMSVILPGVKIGKGALVGASSNVKRDVLPDTVVVGNPAKQVCETKDIKLKNGSDESAYPWRKRFHRGYPEEVVKEWLSEFE